MKTEETPGYINSEPWWPELTHRILLSGVRFDDKKVPTLYEGYFSNISLMQSYERTCNGLHKRSPLFIFLTQLTLKFSSYSTLFCEWVAYPLMKYCSSRHPITFWLIFFNWRKIALQSCIGFCHTTIQTSNNHTCITSLSNLPPLPPPHPIPQGHHIVPCFGLI